MKEIQGNFEALYIKEAKTKYNKYVNKMFALISLFKKLDKYKIYELDRKTHKELEGYLEQDAEACKNPESKFYKDATRCKENIDSYDFIINFMYASGAPVLLECQIDIIKKHQNALFEKIFKPVLVTKQRIKYEDIFDEAKNFNKGQGSEK